MDAGFEARRRVYLAEIARLERALEGAVGKAEARRVRVHTLLRGERGLGDEGPEEGAAGRGLVADGGLEMLRGGVDAELRGRRRWRGDKDAGFAHANGRVGFDAIRVMESQQSLDAGGRRGDRNTQITDDDMFRRGESIQPRSSTIPSVDSQATLVAGRENDSGHVRFADDRRSRPIANVHRGRSTIRLVKSGENLDSQHEYPRNRFSFIEGDDAEGRITQRSSLSSLRRTESQETLV